MINQLAQCPYCKKCEVALDDSPKLVFNPGTSNPGPCQHLIWIDGRYSQWDRGPLGIPRVIGSTEFSWEHPLFKDQVEYTGMIAYLKELASSGPTWEFAPREPFEIRDLWADDKATDSTGAEYAVWDVDGEAVFAQNALTFMAVLPSCQEKQGAVWKLQQD